MKKVKAIFGEIVAAGHDGAVATAVATVCAGLRDDARAAIPDGATPVRVRAVMREHGERGRALDHRLMGAGLRDSLDMVEGGSFEAFACGAVRARALEVAGDEKTVARFLEAPEGKARRADAIRQPGHTDAGRSTGKPGKERRDKKNGKRGGARERRDGKAAVERRAREANANVKVTARRGRPLGDVDAAGRGSP